MGLAPDTLLAIVGIALALFLWGIDNVVEALDKYPRLVRILRGGLGFAMLVTGVILFAAIA